MIAHKLLNPSLMFLLLTIGICCSAQNAEVAVSIPRVVRVEGVAIDKSLKLRAGTVELGLSIHLGNTSSVPIWQERFNTKTDVNGRYSVLMGSTVPGGLPLTLFTEPGEQWLVIEVDGVRQPPIKLSSAPYALSSANAELLGGHPASDFMLAKDCCSFAGDLMTTGTASERPVVGWSKNPDSASFGIYGSVTGRNSTAGIFHTSGGGDLLLGTNERGNVFRVDSNGKGFFNNAIQVGGADFAEVLPVADRLAEPGDVLVIDRSNGKLRRTRESHSRYVAGVVATKPGVIARDSDTALQADEIPVALIGIVPCKVSAENGSVKIGDQLVTAASAGYAMRASRHVEPGTVLGKALEPVEQGKKTILILLYQH
jgi:hypothetical protein